MKPLMLLGKDNCQANPFVFINCRCFENYNEAQKNVIFEGWEVIQSNKIHHHNVFNSELGLQIEFYKEKESLIRIWDTLGNIELTIIQSLADLAAATTYNPIKLK